MSSRIFAWACIVATIATACKSQGPKQRSASQDSAAFATMESYIKTSEQRPFSGRGPVYRLDPSYYDFARGHPRVALEVLKEHLRSGNANHRWNAYDFLIRMMDVPTVRSEVLTILKHAAKTEGLGVREFLVPALKDAETQPDTTRNPARNGGDAG